MTIPTLSTPLASSTPILTTRDASDDERPRVLVVEVDGRLCALPVEWVREVIRPRAITPIPGAPPVARGLVNVRGMVVTVLDLAEALRAERVTDPAPPGKAPFVPSFPHQSSCSSMEAASSVWPSMQYTTCGRLTAVRRLPGRRAHPRLVLRGPTRVRASRADSRVRVTTLSRDSTWVCSSRE